MASTDIHTINSSSIIPVSDTTISVEPSMFHTIPTEELKAMYVKNQLKLDLLNSQSGVQCAVRKSILLDTNKKIYDVLFERTPDYDPNAAVSDSSTFIITAENTDVSAWSRNSGVLRYSTGDETHDSSAVIPAVSLPVSPSVTPDDTPVSPSVTPVVSSAVYIPADYKVSSDNKCLVRKLFTYTSDKKLSIAVKDDANMVRYIKENLCLFDLGIFADAVVYVLERTCQNAVVLNNLIDLTNFVELIYCIFSLNGYTLESLTRRSDNITWIFTDSAPTDIPKLSYAVYKVYAELNKYQCKYVEGSIRNVELPNADKTRSIIMAVFDVDKLLISSSEKKE